MDVAWKYKSLTIPKIRFQEENVKISRFKTIFRRKQKVKRCFGQIN
jgi:hypothetical protein